jgi:hypothetical protein
VRGFANAQGTGTRMPETIWVAIIAAVPPTLAAIAALWQAKRLSKPLADVNRAVNHRTEGQRTLIETVDHMAGDVAELRSALERHLAYHQITEEEEGLA